MIKKHKKEIGIGVIVSLITTAVLKSADWILDVAPSTGHSIVANLTNVIYTIAATQTDSLILTILFSSFLGLVIGSLLPIIIKDISLFRKTLKMEKAISQMQDEKGLEELLKKSVAESNTATSRTDAKETIRERKKTGAMAIFIAILIFSFYLFSNAFVLRPVSIRDKFDRDIIMIYPYVEESDIYELKSKWVQMRSKDEYNQIYNYINQVKMENSLPD